MARVEPQLASGTSQHYDVRRGAAAFAPIIGGFGALCVPTIILIYTVPGAQMGPSAPSMGLAAGLLVVAMLGSLTGSIGLASLSGHNEATVNLPAAAAFLAVPVVVSIVAILGAFDLLAADFLPHATLLLALLAVTTGSSGAFGVILNASVLPVPTSGEVVCDVKRGGRKRWWGAALAGKVKGWWGIAVTSIRSPKARGEVARRSWRVALAGIIPIAGATIARQFGLQGDPNPATVAYVVLLVGGYALTITGGFWGILKTMPPRGGRYKKMRTYEAYVPSLAMSAYVVALLIFLP